MVNRTYSTDTQRVRWLTFKVCAFPNHSNDELHFADASLWHQREAAVSNQNSGGRQKEKVICHLQWRQYSLPTFPKCSLSACGTHITLWILCSLCQCELRILLLSLWLLRKQVFHNHVHIGSGHAVCSGWMSVGNEIVHSSVHSYSHPYA